MMSRMVHDVDSDYYGILNADILLSDSIFSVMDVIDELVANGTISSIVLFFPFFYV